MKKVLIFAMMVALVSCNKKKYKYVEIREETDYGKK